jgi:Tfp pilus assembly protein PilV
MHRTRGRIATLALACLLLLSLSSSYALAQQQQPATSADATQEEEKASKKAKKADKKQRHKYKGVISAVNGTEVTFKRANGEDRKLTLNSEPRVKANGEEGSVSDLNWLTVKLTGVYINSRTSKKTAYRQLGE